MIPAARKCRFCGRPSSPRLGACSAQLTPGSGDCREATWDFYHLRCWRKAAAIAAKPREK